MIREYCFECNCKEEFSIFCEMQDISGYIPPCPVCKHNKYVFRNFGMENIGFKNSVPQTVGALADKHSEERLKRGLPLTQEKTVKQLRKNP